MVICTLWISDHISLPLTEELLNVAPHLAGLVINGRRRTGAHVLRQTGISCMTRLWAAK